MTEEKKDQELQEQNLGKVAGGYYKSGLSEAEWSRQQREKKQHDKQFKQDAGKLGWYGVTEEDWRHTVTYDPEKATKKKPWWKIW